MKKLFAFILFTSFTCQLGAWKFFKINNNTNETIEFITESGKIDIEKDTTHTIVNNRHSRKWGTTKNILQKIENEIILGKDEDWFKIGEKTPAAGRTYTIAPRINIGENAHGTIIVSDILDINNKNLPRGFEYHEYATGLIIPTNKTYETGERQIK